MKTDTKDTYAIINLEEYFPTGEGGTSITYNKKDGTSLAKLFIPGFQADTAAREFHISETVHSLGIPSPLPIRLITDGKRFGAEYELIAPKRSFTRIISEERDKLEELSIRFAHMAKDLHSTPAPTSALPSMKDLMAGWIEEHRDLLTDEEYGGLLGFLGKVPEVDTCLHGDLHIGNVIRTTGRDLWIDLGDFAYGDPRWDLGMMYYACNSLSDERLDSIFHNDRATMRSHWEIFAREYYGVSSQGDLQEIEHGLLPFIGTKLFYVVTKLTHTKSPFTSGIIKKFVVDY